MALRTLCFSLEGKGSEGHTGDCHHGNGKTDSISNEVNVPENLFLVLAQ